MPESLISNGSSANAAPASKKSENGSQASKDKKPKGSFVQNCYKTMRGWLSLSPQVHLYTKYSLLLISLVFLVLCIVYMTCKCEVPLTHGDGKEVYVFEGNEPHLTVQIPKDITFPNPQSGQPYAIDPKVFYAEGRKKHQAMGVYTNTNRTA